MKKLQLIFFFINTYFSISQEYKVSGVLYSIQNEPVQNATILVYQENEIIAYTYSNTNGRYQTKFNLKGRESNKLKIVANSLGFQEKERIISIENKTEYNLDFILEEKAEQLNEVVLEAREKIKVKQDTITYKVSAFKEGSETVVEDLLKNIPGIEVLSDGNIKVNGKAIDKLLIEGDDLFDDKYKLLTKNLDANNIEEVEVLNNFEDNPVLKNFQESEKVALNLKLKEDKKNVWFGNFDLGYGTYDRYNSTANIGLLKKKIKFFNLTNVNSIGRTAISQVKNTGKLNISGFDTSKKIEKTNNTFVNIDNLSSTNFSNNEDIFNNSFLNSLSFVTNLSKQTKIRSLTYFTYDEIEKQNDNITEYFIEPEVISFNEQNRVNIKDLSFATELELKHYSENETYFTYDFTFENNPTETKGNLIFNNDNILQFQDDKKYNFFNHLSNTKKITNNTLLLAYGYLGINNTKQDYTIQPNIFSDIFNNDEDLTITQNSNTPLSYYGLISEIVTKGKKSEYGLEFSATVDRDRIENSFRFDNQTPVDTISNNTDYKNTRISILGKYNYDISKLFKISSSLSVSQNYLDVNNTKKDFFFINPKIRFHTKKTKIGNFGISYSYQNNLPQARYLTEDFILTNYRTFNRGTNDIQQINNHSFGFFYTFNNYKKQFLINSFLLHSFADKSYGLNSQITEQTNFNEYQIIDGGKLTNYNLSITRYLKAFSSTLKVSTQQSWSNNPIIINNNINEVINYNANYRIQGTTYFKLPVNFKFGFQYNYSKGEFDNQISTNEYLESNLGATLKLSDQWLFKIENNYYSINENDYWFINANLNYNPEKSHFSYRLSANNLSNITEFKDIFISEFQRNETNFRVIPSYILLNIKYRF
ncbi:carboxypeptidase-like regulatory domain-containing protein [Zobellia galactanivorans]|uniref:TonB-dependent Receptor n=1 Tax=Zobellia galactanivorans (strain DSM 12802 / CCUG 47099 / CIP 106680 / NCIMB 13871 / Dsij) TaxID=63186 RepID=G0L8A8_ZOBGA|nr:carboxypeptidase-like regulatory domain-containing protein [Zobellia galactanivorans]CAZ97442.1 TonB-dependent Receptor [Zobellia galactanivorans]